MFDVVECILFSFSRAAAIKYQGGGPGKISQKEKVSSCGQFSAVTKERRRIAFAAKTPRGNDREFIKRQLSGSLPKLMDFSFVFFSFRRPPSFPPHSISRLYFFHYSIATAFHFLLSFRPHCCIRDRAGSQKFRPGSRRRADGFSFTRSLIRLSFSFILVKSIYFTGLTCT